MFCEITLTFDLGPAKHLISSFLKLLGCLYHIPSRDIMFTKAKPHLVKSARPWPLTTKVERLHSWVQVSIFTQFEGIHIKGCQDVALKRPKSCFVKSTWHLNLTNQNLFTSSSIPSECFFYPIWGNSFKELLRYIESMGMGNIDCETLKTTCPEHRGSKIQQTNIQ